ncbi:MAG: hypothetical protein C4548_13720 [Desulfobacteraceae bacterium]|nr:MAG: hypothetical protein C4548_13720 [Desulfobacteraceae bacterium]
MKINSEVTMSFELIGSFLFGIGLLVFYILIYKTNQYVKSQGHKPTIPFPELFKFLSDCSRIQKETNDHHLRLLIIAINSVFALCAIVLLILVAV